MQIICNITTIDKYYYIFYKYPPFFSIYSIPLEKTPYICKVLVYRNYSLGIIPDKKIVDVLGIKKEDYLHLTI